MMRNFPAASEGGVNGYVLHAYIDVIPHAWMYLYLTIISPSIAFTDCERFCNESVKTVMCVCLRFILLENSSKCCGAL